RSRPANPDAELTLARHQLVRAGPRLLESIERLAARGEILQLWIALGRHRFLQPKPDISEQASDRDIGLRELASEVPRRLGITVEHGERPGKLTHAAGNPFMRDASMGMEVAFIDNGCTFLDGTARQYRRLHDAPPLVSAPRHECALRPHQLVEIIEDRT